MVYQTPRLFARRLDRGDMGFLRSLLQDEAVMYAYEHAFSDAEVDEWMNRQLDRYQNFGFGLWAVVEKQSGRVIGQCGLSWQNCDGTQVLEVGYLFSKEFWKQGFALEAGAGALDYAFQTLGATEVYAIIRDTNIPSTNVAIGLGMKVRHRFVKHYYNIDMPHLAFSVKKDDFYRRHNI